MSASSLRYVGERHGDEEQAAVTPVYHIFFFVLDACNDYDCVGPELSSSALPWLLGKTIPCQEGHHSPRNVPPHIRSAMGGLNKFSQLGI